MKRRGPAARQPGPSPSTRRGLPRRHTAALARFGTSAPSERDAPARLEADAERERLLAEIERQRDLLAAVIDQFPAGVIVSSGDDVASARVSMVSKQFEILWGRPCAVGGPLAGHAGEHPAWYPDGRRLADGDYGGSRALRGESVRQELVFERGDGTRYPVLDVGAPLRDRRGRVVGSIGSFSDISAEKAAAREREHLLAETRRAVRIRDEVLAVVSHNLRNHLSVVVFAAAQLAARADGDPKAVGALAEQIRRAASGMGQIMCDLLDAARIETGKLTVDPTDEDAAEVVGDAIDLFTAVAATRGVELRASLAELAGVRVRCNRGRVVQVLSNLIGNALKFVPLRRAVEVRGRRREREVIVSVRDEGPGLSPESLPHVFDPYWQAERRDARRGIGLGLSIAKGIVEAHGGRVWVESTPGEGAVFSFSLPLAVDA